MMGHRIENARASRACRFVSLTDLGKSGYQTEPALIGTDETLPTILFLSLSLSDENKLVFGAGEFISRALMNSEYVFIDA